jgi:hypothetical protein
MGYDEPRLRVTDVSSQSMHAWPQKICLTHAGREFRTTSGMSTMGCDFTRGDLPRTRAYRDFQGAH